MLYVSHCRILEKPDYESRSAILRYSFYKAIGDYKIKVLSL